MCWSGEASASIAAIGIGSTAYFAYRGEDRRLWLPLGYFALMEALQAYTYTVIDLCDDPRNQVATVLGFIHILFQPFFANYLSLYFVPARIRKLVEPFVYTFCFYATVSGLLSMYPFSWAELCPVGERAFCGTRLCSISGDWHIAWEMPRNTVGAAGLAYWIAIFALPILYGSWRVTIYHIVTGPLLAGITTGSWNEMAAVWCLYSIGLLLIAIKTPIRRILHVEKWFWWRFVKE